MNDVWIWKRAWFFFGIIPPIADFEKRFFQVHEGRRHLLTSALDALSLTILENLEIYFKKGLSWSTFKVFNKTDEFCCSRSVLVQLNLNDEMITNLNPPLLLPTWIMRLYCCWHWSYILKTSLSRLQYIYAYSKYDPSSYYSSLVVVRVNGTTCRRFFITGHIKRLYLQN